MKACIVWRRFGPYHHARLTASVRRFRAEGAQLVGLETIARAGVHLGPREETNRAELVTLFRTESVGSLSRRQLFRSVRSALDRIDPDAVAVPAYSTPEAQAGLAWARDRRRIAVVMTATGRGDAPRVAWREWAKQAIVSQFDSALAGGTPQARYIGELGVPGERIFTPYDVVDNDFFARRAAAARSNRGALEHLPGLGNGRPFFLAVGRLMERKNYENLLRAYAEYRCHHRDGPPWDLVLLGDGPERARLVELADALAPGGVTFGGYRQIDEIAAYYGLAGAFVHPAIVEQWGLVINEAMATGLPVVVSRSVGAVEDLVIDGENGYRFDPRDPSAIAKALLRVSAPDADRARMGRSSRERVAHWSLDRFAEGLWQAVVAGAESADRSMPLGVRALVWSNQRSPGALLRWRSVEP